LENHLRVAVLVSTPVHSPVHSFRE
jgi:hypothetical protein